MQSDDLCYLQNVPGVNRPYWGSRRSSPFHRCVIPPFLHLGMEGDGVGILGSAASPGSRALGVCLLPWSEGNSNL